MKVIFRGLQSHVKNSTLYDSHPVTLNIGGKIVMWVKRE